MAGVYRRHIVQKFLGIYSSSYCSIWMLCIILMQISIITDTSNHKTREIIYQSSYFHFHIKYSKLAVQIILDYYIFYYLISRHNNTIVDNQTAVTPFVLNFVICYIVNG